MRLSLLAAEDEDGLYGWCWAEEEEEEGLRDARGRPGPLLTPRSMIWMEFWICAANGANGGAKSREHNGGTIAKCRLLTIAVSVIHPMAVRSGAKWVKGLLKKIHKVTRWGMHLRVREISVLTP